MCMCLAWGGVGGEWIKGLGLGFTNPVRRVSALGLQQCRWEVGGGLDQGLGGSDGVIYVCGVSLFV